jgi:iron complex transport system substrate-binding protein
MKRILALPLIGLFLFAVSLPSTVEAASFIDQSGHTVVIKRPFNRIISLYPAHTENLFFLGLHKEIIGVSENEAYPPEAMEKPVFSYHDDAERLLAAKPDLVLIRPMIENAYPKLISKLREAGIEVVSLQPKTIDDMFVYWRELGMLTGREKQAEKMIERFREGFGKMASIVETIPRSERKRVYFEAIHSRMKTFSPSSIAIFVLKSAGGINIAEDADTVGGTNIADYGKEHILSHADKIDVYLSQQGVMNHATAREIMEEGGFEAIKAVRDGKVYIVDEKIVSRPTPRLLEGIYEIARILYPDKFNDISVLKKRPFLTRAEFAEMFIKTLNLPLKTPDYRRDIKKRSDIQHRYGDFKDIDYTGGAYKFIETAVYRGLFPNVKKHEFDPDEPIKRSDVAYSLFVYFDLPKVEKKILIDDVNHANPLSEQIYTAVGLGCMTLTPGNLFRPDDPVSGMEAFRIISKARQVAAANSRQ